MDIGEREIGFLDKAKRNVGESGRWGVYICLLIYSKSLAGTNENNAQSRGDYR